MASECNKLQYEGIEIEISMVHTPKQNKPRLALKSIKSENSYRFSKRKFKDKICFGNSLERMKGKKTTKTKHAILKTSKGKHKKAIMKKL